jgi:two-component system, NtrC family, sensor histidine kinase KinB
MLQSNENTSLEILYSVSRELAASLDLHTVLERILSLSTSNIGAERASLVVLDEKGQPIDAAMIQDGQLVTTTIVQMKDVVTSGLAGWVIQNKNYVVLQDTQKDERWLPRPRSGHSRLMSQSALCVPLMAREKLVGVLTIVHPRVNFFTDDYVSLQRAIADMAGIAIQNAELFEEVRTAQARYYDLFEESIDPIIITDNKGMIIETNNEAALVTGYAKEELIHGAINSIHEISITKVGKKFEHLSENKPIIYESNLVGKLLKRTPVEVHVSTIMIAGEHYAQWIFRDVKERKALDKLREDLSAMIYHDLRSPLANIISSLEIMTSMLPLSEEGSLKTVFEIANRSTERMQRMISGLLDINRLDSGQQIIDKKSISVNVIFNEAVETISPTAKSKEITIEQNLQPGIPKILMDADMIRRVLTNLLENSVKFSPNGSTVTIGAKKEGGKVFLWVDDQGSGIPEDARERIFEKFVQLSTSQTTKGLGLGLAFCQLAVQAHGGTIWVDNLPQGGSRFSFTLPLH